MFLDELSGRLVSNISLFTLEKASPPYLNPCLFEIEVLSRSGSGSIRVFHASRKRQVGSGQRLEADGVVVTTRSRARFFVACYHQITKCSDLNVKRSETALQRFFFQLLLCEHLFGGGRACDDWVVFLEPWNLPPFGDSFGGTCRRQAL